MKLISTPDLATALGVGRTAVGSALAKLDVQPVYSIPQGAGHIDIWDHAAVFDKLKAVFDAKRPAPQAQLPLSSVPDLKPLYEEMHKAARRVDDSLDDMEKTNTAIRDTMKKLSEQNVLLLRMLEDIRATTYSKIDALQATVDTVHSELSAFMHPAPVMAPSSVPDKDALPATLVEVPSTAAPLRRVAIISLLPDQKAMIEREFGKALDLRIFSGQEARNNGIQERIANCEVVFVMANFVDGTITDHIKKAKVKMVKVSGGLTRLRDELTNLFCMA